MSGQLDDSAASHLACVTGWKLLDRLSDEDLLSRAHVLALRIGARSLPPREARRFAARTVEEVRKALISFHQGARPTHLTVPFAMVAKLNLDGRDGK